jgi:hypothetical protein
MSKRVYLGGPITSNPYTWEWREEAEQWFLNRNVMVLDPMRGKSLDSIKGLGFTSDIPGKHFVARDFVDVKCAHCILCNFLFIPDRQCVGSLMELGAAHALGVPYIVVATHEHFLKHPFITETAVDVVSTLEEGMEICRFLLS